MCSSAILPVDTVLPALTPRFLAGVRGHHNDSNSDSNSDIEEKKEDPFWTVREEPQRASYTETEPEPKIPSTSTPCFHHEDETETARWLWSPTNDRARATEDTLPGGCNNDEAIHLFASFSSSPQTSLWHYSHDSPRLESSKQRRWSIAAPVVSPSTRGGGNAYVDGTFSGNDNGNDTGTTAPPEPLPWMPDPRRSLSAKQSDEDRPPTLIRCRRLSVCSIITVGSYLSNGNHNHNHNSDNNIVDNHNGNHNGNGNHDSHPHRHHDYGASVSCHYADEDDEEVSLLADDPDDDDDDVLPHATYDVLANLFDDI